MRILILTFYYRPDLSAGSFRTAAFVDALCGQVPPGTHIDVVTTLPHRYRSFTADAPEHEQHQGLSIRRIALGEHGGGLWDQSRAFGLFARQALRHVRCERYDLVYATSSRLMTAALGAWIARRCGALLYLDIRDIFADTIGDVLRPQFAWLARTAFSALERRTVGRASKVNLVSRGFTEYFRSRYPKQQFSFFTNGIDDEFLKPMPKASSRRDAHAIHGRHTVLYAGNVGEGQGLHRILPPLAKLMEKRVRFLVIGDGARKDALTAALAASRVTNVEVMPPVNRSDLRRAYDEADVLFLHLNDHAAFEKVLPSKLFEYAAIGKPIWAGVAGHAADFVRAEIANAAVFEPCNASAAALAFDQLLIDSTPRSEFVGRYARANISRQLAADVLNIAQGAG